MLVCKQTTRRNDRLVIWPSENVAQASSLSELVSSANEERLVVIHLTGLSNQNQNSYSLFHWNSPRVSLPSNQIADKLRRLPSETEMFAPNVLCVLFLNHVLKPEFKLRSVFFPANDESVLPLPLSTSNLFQPWRSFAEIGSFVARAQTKPLKNINYKKYNAVNTTMSFVQISRRTIQIVYCCLF